MSRFDEEPDGDPHGECALEIHRLEARIAELEASVLKITADCNAVVCGKSDRITELEAEVARLRVDGGRYRWLREDCPWTLLAEVFKFPLQDENTYAANMVSLDREVDAAIAAAKESA